MSIERPVYKHDCGQCVFLGIYQKENDHLVDLYFCKQHKIPTLIARYSSRGDDYISGLGFADHFPEMMAAKDRATTEGLLLC